MRNSNANIFSKLDPKDSIFLILFIFLICCVSCRFYELGEEDVFGWFGLISFLLGLFVIFFIEKNLFSKIFHIKPITWKLDFFFLVMGYVVAVAIWFAAGGGFVYIYSGEHKGPDITRRPLLLALILVLYAIRFFAVLVIQWRKYYKETKYLDHFIDLRDKDDKKFEAQAHLSLNSEDEDIANRIVHLIQQFDQRYTSNRKAAEDIHNKLKNIGQKLFNNGGDSRMRKIAYRAIFLGKEKRVRSRDIEYHWNGIGRWQY